MFRGVFEEEVEKRLGTLPWCERVIVAFCPAEQGWDESRMSPAARAALQAAGARTPRCAASQEMRR